MVFDKQRMIKPKPKIDCDWDRFCSCALPLLSILVAVFFTLFMACKTVPFNEKPDLYGISCNDEVEGLQDCFIIKVKNADNDSNSGYFNQQDMQSRDFPTRKEWSEFQRLLKNITINRDDIPNMEFNMENHGQGCSIFRCKKGDSAMGLICKKNDNEHDLLHSFAFFSMDPDNGLALKNHEMKFKDLGLLITCLKREFQ